MYGETILPGAMAAELAGRPLAWAVTAGVMVAVVAVLGTVRAFSKARGRMR
jgi:hypothetical protein